MVSGRVVAMVMPRSVTVLPSWSVMVCGPSTKG
ncbi:Uncharacterised protein [Bordetella pertussis]|nr:Uncharacterised protein [Bordetella pertussis]CPM32460.1 Uncharacterised protein [Bordetella pertussis]